MPPKGKKKEAHQTVIAQYDVKIMTADELKHYVLMLQKEIEQMRKDCNFYIRERDSLNRFYNISQDEVLAKNKQLMLKDVELERLKAEFDEELRAKDQVSKYIEHENNERIERQALNSIVHLKNEEARHHKEERLLEKRIEEKDKEVEALRLYCEVAVKDMKEKNDKNLTEMNEYHKHMLENTIQDYVKLFLKSRAEFRQEKNAAVNEALEGRIFGENKYDESCSNYIEKMQSYFKEITWKNIATINELQKKIADLQMSSEKTKLHLQDVLQENREMKAAKMKFVATKSLPTKISKGDYTPADKMATDFKKSLKKIDELDYANHVLGEKLRLVTSERDKLRNEFISALRKVRQKSELKTLFLETKLRSIYNDKYTESGISELLSEAQEVPPLSPTAASNPTPMSGNKSVAFENDEDDETTIINITLENSETMHVPPKHLGNPENK